MESFFIEPRNIKKGLAFVNGEEFHHLVRVLRKKVGELIYLFDGSGKIYTAKIVKITKENAECEIIEENFMRGELDVEIAVGQAILKNPERFEFALEKLTEIGVRQIIPILTERVIVSKNPKDISPNKIERWRKIILSACKQSNRALIPELFEPVAFEEFISLEKYEKKIIFHESEVNSLNRILLHDYLKNLKSVKSILLAIGPEGGFTDDEVKEAVESGFDVVSLGCRRLRSETSSIVSTGVIAQFFISETKSL